jgi:hypothetical protein
VTHRALRRLKVWWGILLEGKCTKRLREAVQRVKARSEAHTSIATSQSRTPRTASLLQRVRQKAGINGMIPRHFHQIKFGV